jgi:5-enolpyruvylshikimate-3-phosphate synthase
MELTRPRKMELLHTPKLDLLRMMRENSLTIEDVIFLFASNKLAPIDIRMNAPTICDKMLTIFLRQMAAKQETTMPPMAA